MQAGYRDRPILVPCGQCIGCRLDRSRQWAIRCVHEASLHGDNAFVTLTYNDENLPFGGTLVKRDLQLFMKRLRKAHGAGIRFYGCGEYGEELVRPHYHVCLFNYTPPDKIPFKEGTYTSQSLDRIWGKGFTLTGDVTFQSAAYVARYIMKKVNGSQAANYYKSDVLDPNTGEITRVDRVPEFTTMSRRPGIGKKWYEKFKSDVYDWDFVVHDGKTMRAPRYYDKQFENSNPSDYTTLKRKRVRNSRKHKEDQTPERLRVREHVKNAQIGKLSRKIE